MSSEVVQTRLEQVLNFANGRSSPDRDDHARYPVFGSNGLIGRAATSNSEPNTIVIGRVGSYCGSVHFSKDACWVTDNAIRATAKNDNDPSFLFYLLKHLNLNAWRSGSGQPLINQATLNAIEAPIPSPHVQSEIASVISAFDDRINLLRETNTTLEAIAQALFKSWFVDFDPVHAKMQGRAPEGMDQATAALFPDSFEESELGAVPKGWSVGAVGVIAEVIDCLHSKKPELIESSHLFLQLSNIRDDGLLDTSEVAGISEADYKKWISRIEVGEGDCVITNVGRVGAVAQIPAGYKAAMGRNMTAVRLRKVYPFPTYLVELLQSPDMRTEIAAKTDVGTILDALNVRSIPTLRCVLASYGVLNEFESIARPMRARMEANIAKIQTLSSVRDTLLPRLISGQLSVIHSTVVSEV